MQCCLTLSLPPSAAYRLRNTSYSTVPGEVPCASIEQPRCADHRPRPPLQPDCRFLIKSTETVLGSELPDLRVLTRSSSRIGVASGGSQHRGEMETVRPFVS